MKYGKYVEPRVHTPEEGTENWHEPLNENFEDLDSDIEVRGSGAPSLNYDPVEGAKYLDTDNGIVYIASEQDEENVEWNAAFRLPEQDGPGGSAVFDDVPLETEKLTTETLSVETESGDNGSYTATVSTDDDSASTGVTVEEPPDPATLQVSINSTTSPVTEGQTFEVTARIENTGDESDTQTVALDVDGLSDSDSTRAEFPSGQYNLPRCHNQADTGVSQRHNPVL